MTTIKYYQREGLLPAGERSGPNQVTYGEEHLQRISTIRALREVANLRVAEIRRAMAAIDSPGMEVAHTIDVVRAMIGSAEAGPEAADAASARADPTANEEVLRFLGEIGWRVDPRSSVIPRLTGVLQALRATLGPEIPVEAFWPYAKAIEPIAEMEIGYYRRELSSDSKASAVQAAVTGTILWERVLTALRLAAHEHFLAVGDEGEMNA